MTPDSPRRAAAPTPVAGGDHIRPEWALAVARAQTLEEARVVLAAVVPAIQAQALRDAAEALGDYARGRSPLHVGLYAKSFVNDRADRIEFGELP